MKKPKRAVHAARAVVGWREWVALPDLGVPMIKAKVDTGARSSAIHVSEMEAFRKRGREMVRFVIHPEQRNSTKSVWAEAEVFEWRRIKSSGGHASRRAVILTTVELLGQGWEIELTLASRDTMGFRMLLGRQAIRGRMVVDPGASYYGPRPRKRARRTVFNRNRRDHKDSSR